MQITREADYAIRTMLEVASQPMGVPTTTMQVSRRKLVPRPFVRKIVRRLTAAGLLRTRRGNSGGLLLARRPEEISLLSVIDAANSVIAINRCVLQPDSCALQPTCSVHEVCREARDNLVRLFGSVSLRQLVERSQELKAAPAAEERPQAEAAQPRSRRASASTSRTRSQPAARVGGPAADALAGTEA